MTANIRFEASSVITMSAPRQKPRFILFVGLVFCAAFTVLCAAPGWSIVGGPVVTDPQTGLAIDGFDPVAYFTDSAALPGRPEFEYRAAGVTWRFRNEANRTVFVDHPEIYAPQFGGYDPVAIGRGVSVAGHPKSWVISGERLFLFYDDKARSDFLSGPNNAFAAAQRRWPDVRRTLP